MKTQFSGIQLGLYRDDGLGLSKAQSGSELERTKKAIIRFFQGNGLKITIDINLTQVNFLDVTLDLSTSKYWPYRKDGDPPLYIHKDSNHAPTITRQLPNMIESRISALSCNENEFNKVKDTYDTSLLNSGFIHKIQFTKKSTTRNRRQRRRNITWFNPPYNSAVKTNLGRQFLSLIDRHFPAHHKFGKLFNRSSIKISYSASPNMSSIISKHNKKILNNSSTCKPLPPRLASSQSVRQARGAGAVQPPGHASHQALTQVLSQPARRTSQRVDSTMILRSQPARQVSPQVFTHSSSQPALQTIPCVELPKASASQPTISVPLQAQRPVLSQRSRQEASSMCNCRQRDACPLNGQCLVGAIIYKATVTSEERQTSYIGSTELPFKDRYTNHKSSFTLRHKASSTSLSTYIWDLKDKGLSHEIKWEILKRCSPYVAGMRRCDLCLTEKLLILQSNPGQVLNKNSEIMQKCRHNNKFKLINVK